MPFQVFEAPASSILSDHQWLYRASGIHALPDARAELHVRMQLLLRSHHAHLWRLEAGRLAPLGTIHHVQKQRAGIIAAAIARGSGDLLFAAG